MPRRAILFGVLLALGAAGFEAFNRRFGEFMPTSWPAVALYGGLVIVVLCFAPLRETAMRIVDRLDEEHRTSRTVLGVVVFIATALYLYANALLHNRDLTPRFHDEHSYLIQAQMMARGRLWMPPFPDGLADFFESFRLIVKPVYASIYFPGTAVLWVPGVLAGVPPWVTAILVNAAAGTLLFLVAARLMRSNAYGLLAAIMFIATPRVRWSSASTFSHPVAMLVGLLIIWCWLRWREDKRAVWAIALGATIGWSAIVRPFDMIAYGIPIGTIFLLELRKLRPREIAATISIILLAAMPFIALQLLVNRGTTGDPLKTPYRAYLDEFEPGWSLGFHPLPPPDVRPQTTLPQKLDLYEGFAWENMRVHRADNIYALTINERVPYLPQNVLPSMLLIVLLPLAFVGAVRERTRLAIAFVPYLFMLLYVFSPYFMQHYAMVVAPAVILSLLFAIDALDQALSRFSPALRAVPLIVVLGITLPGLPEFRFDFERPEPDAMSSMWILNTKLPDAAGRGSVVLFHYERGWDPHAEPVYNVDVASPLTAPVIRAHDLGPERDLQLIKYFAAHEPKRMFYLFIRHPEHPTFIKLGRAGEWKQWFATSALFTKPWAATTQPTTSPRR